jgi:signal transduction histidine kinase
VGGCLDIHDRKEGAEKSRIADESLRLVRAQDEERRRIAREFHDSAGQTLTVLGLSLAQLVQKAQTIAPELAQEGKEIEDGFNNSIAKSVPRPICSILRF